MPLYAPYAYGAWLKASKVTWRYRVTWPIVPRGYPSWAPCYYPCLSELHTLLFFSLQLVSPHLATTETSGCAREKMQPHLQHLSSWSPLVFNLVAEQVQIPTSTATRTNLLPAQGLGHPHPHTTTSRASRNVVIRAGLWPQPHESIGTLRSLQGSSMIRPSLTKAYNS